MILSNNDIEKIQNIGYNKNFFVKRSDGWKKLKNKNGKCVFHNGKICMIYDQRPEGCKLYPLIFNIELKSAIIDSFCPYKNDFSFNLEDSKKLYDVIKQIIYEKCNNKKI
ncbi:hypothetical protein AYK20_06485 [Thermoplasmatales archaeon SG8-52-1]|nr:MAG: hypothetical protein AYK20_06485 [Thermoplasmatales archaeon SG8-52-1]